VKRVTGRQDDILPGAGQSCNPGQRVNQRDSGKRRGGRLGADFVDGEGVPSPSSIHDQVQHADRPAYGAAPDRLFAVERHRLMRT
jgi:hypothetical protein